MTMSVCRRFQRRPCRSFFATTSHRAGNKLACAKTAALHKMIRAATKMWSGWPRTARIATAPLVYQFKAVVVTRCSRNARGDAAVGSEHIGQLDWSTTAGC